MLLLSILKKYLKNIGDMDQWDLIEELSNQRADSLIAHALKGFNITMEEAIEILNNHSEDPEDIEERGIVDAAMNNMVEFAVAEEYHVVKAMSEKLSYSIGDIEDLDEEELEELVAEFEKYNLRYARVENSDVEQAMSIAMKWVLFSASSMLMYMTMGDERVRPWHLDLEGYTAPKSSFPEWMIPPIEHQCRCYLVEAAGPEASANLKDVKAEIVKIPSKPYDFNNTFKESVCLGGRIFSDEHPYFQIESSDFARLNLIKESIRKRYNL